jgi:hypothetical protein
MGTKKSLCNSVSTFSFRDRQIKIEGDGSRKLFGSRSTVADGFLRFIAVKTTDAAVKAPFSSCKMEHSSCKMKFFSCKMEHLSCKMKHFKGITGHFQG